MSNHIGSSGSGKPVGFDPYHKWLGIPPREQPPNHYRLLGVAVFEQDADVIANAADARMAHLKTFQTGEFSAHSQRMLNEIARAKLCLLMPERKAEYDRMLREQLNAAEQRATADGPAPLATDDSDCYELRQEPVVAGQPLPPYREEDVIPSPLRSSAKRRKKTSDRMLHIGILAATAVAVAVIVPIYLLSSRNGNPRAAKESETVAGDTLRVPSHDEAANAGEGRRFSQPRSSLGKTSDLASSPSAEAEDNGFERPRRPQQGEGHPKNRPAPIRGRVHFTPGSSVAAVEEKTSEADVSETTPLSQPDLIERVEPSIVVIETEKDRGREGLGSGFVIDEKGHIVTNYHVIDETRNATARFSNEMIVKIVGYVAVDKGRDLAIIRAKLHDNMKLKPLQIRSDYPRKGEPVVAFGAPKGLDFTATSGIVSAIRNGKQISDIMVKWIGIDLLHGYDPEAIWIQTNAAISSGNSGGPLIDMQGRVVGVNTWTRPPIKALNESQVQNLNFAISAKSITKLLSSMSVHAEPFTSLPRPKRPPPRIADDDDDDENKKASSPRIYITLPSGAILNEPMLDMPDDWAEKYFPENVVAYLSKWPNGDVRGVYSLDNAKLDGYAIELYESGYFHTFARYKSARLDGRMMQWKEDGRRLLFAQHKRGNKHGLICLFRNNLPWLLQEWDKGSLQSGYLVSYSENRYNLIPKTQFSDRQTEEYGTAQSELALLESSFEDDGNQLKRELAQWYREESHKIRRQRASRLSQDKLRSILGAIADHSRARAAGFLNKKRRIQSGNY